MEKPGKDSAAPTWRKVLIKFSALVDGCTYSKKAILSAAIEQIVQSAHERQPALDLLRASAIVMVLTAHSVLAFGAPKNIAFLQLGGIGVDLFFVLSGWLLGGQLIDEYCARGAIDCRRFWMRRWMRTLPAYYAVLLLTLAQQLISHPENRLRLDYLVFLQNYAGSLPYFAVSWSLCVEEHFYLLIAPAIVLFSRLGRIRWPLIAVILISPFCFRQMGWYGSVEETHVRWDGCMLGVLLAVCHRMSPNVWRRLARMAPTLGSVAIMLLIGNMAGRMWPNLGMRDYERLIYALIFASLLLLAATPPWGNRLYIPGCKYVAIRAYSIYLVHPEILAVMKKLPCEMPFPLFYALAWVGSLALAEALYRIIEKPFMDARSRIATMR